MGISPIEPLTPSQHRSNLRKMNYPQLYAIYKRRQREKGVKDSFKPPTKRKTIELIMHWYA